jgi:HAE1 family hydrophobic/amphiphilic exporter-1
MTTVAMIVGMLPIALSRSSGSEWKTGLAWALIGGLSSSMFLTLFLVPSVFSYLTQLFSRFRRHKPEQSSLVNGIGGHQKEVATTDAQH